VPRSRPKKNGSDAPPPGPREAVESSPIANRAHTSEKGNSDPRLRPFIVAMANAIIKDMLREQEEKHDE
jgi:hypothetical protein